MDRSVRGGRRPVARGDSGALCLRERHRDAPAPGPEGRAIRDARGPCRDSGPARSSRGGRSSGQRSPSRTCRDYRWRSVPAATSCGPKALAGRISRIVRRSRQQTRFRIGTASVALTSAAVGLLLEKGRLNSTTRFRRTCPRSRQKQWPVTLRQLMGHLAGVRHYRGEEGLHAVGALRAGAGGLQKFADDPLRFEPGTQYQVFDVWLGPGERGGRSRCERAVLRVHAQSDLRAAGHGRHDARLREGTDPGPRDLLFPEVQRGYALRSRSGDRSGLLLLRRSRRVPVHAVRPGAVRDRGQQRQAAAARHRRNAPDDHSG